MASFMSDLFGGANNAAQDQTSAIMNGLTLGMNQVNNGSNALQSNYTSALQPYLQNNQTAQGGVTAMGNLLGLNGAAGSQSAQTALQNMPGYQFSVQQGDNAVNAAAAANGTLNSGNQLLALSKENQGLASQNYNNYVSQLQPYMNMAQSSAQGIGNTYQGLGNALDANSLSQAGMITGAATGIGNANASADLSNQSMGMGLLGGGLKFLSGGGLGNIGSALSGLGNLNFGGGIQ